jgi:DNA-binding MarR family transcriptional regulator
MGKYGSMLGGLFKKSSAVYGLTDVGKQKHDNMTASGPKLDILVYLNDNGSSSIREISEQLHLDERKVKAAVNAMINDSWIMPTGRN